MADSADEVVASCCSLVLAAGLGAAIILNRSRKQTKTLNMGETIHYYNSDDNYTAKIYARNDVIDDFHKVSYTK